MYIYLNKENRLVQLVEQYQVYYDSKKTYSRLCSLSQSKLADHQLFKSIAYYLMNNENKEMYLFVCNNRCVLNAITFVPVNA